MGGGSSKEAAAADTPKSQPLPPQQFAPSGMIGQVGAMGGGLSPDGQGAPPIQIQVVVPGGFSPGCTFPAQYGGTV